MPRINKKQMIIIEFFGPSGSGKSYFKKRLVKNFPLKILDYKSVYNLISDRSLVSKLFYNFIKLSYLQKIKDNFIISKIKKIFYGFIKIKKIENSQSTKRGSKLHNKIELIKKLILKSKFTNNNKKNFENWANEEVHVNHYARNKIKKQKILVDSEGLIQRLFIYCYKQKNKNKIIKEYLNLIEIPQIMVFFDKKIINKKNRIKMEKNEEKIIFKLTLSELKKRNILIIDSKIGINKSYLMIKENIKMFTKN
jgi:hypothetical protein